MSLRGDNKKGAAGMEKVREKQRRSLGKLGASIKSFFGGSDAKKKKKKTKKVLDDAKVSDFKKGFGGH